MNKERDLIGAGWLHPEDAESLQLYANRLRLGWGPGHNAPSVRRK